MARAFFFWLCSEIGKVFAFHISLSATDVGAFPIAALYISLSFHRSLSLSARLLPHAYCISSSFEPFPVFFFSRFLRTIPLIYSLYIFPSLFSLFCSFPLCFFSPLSFTFTNNLQRTLSHKPSFLSSTIRSTENISLDAETTVNAEIRLAKIISRNANSGISGMLLNATSALFLWHCID